MSLKEIRINKGWSVEAAAELMHLDNETLLKREKYKEFPDMQEMASISSFLDMSIDDVIYLICQFHRLEKVW